MGYILELKSATINKRMNDFEKNHILIILTIFSLLIYPIFGRFFGAEVNYTLGLIMAGIPLGLHFFQVRFLGKPDGLARVLFTGKVLYIFFLINIIWLIILPMRDVSYLFAQYMGIEISVTEFAFFITILFVAALFYFSWTGLIYPRLLERVKISVDYHFLELGKDSIEYLGYTYISSIPILFFSLTLFIPEDVYKINCVFLTCILAFFFYINYDPLRHGKDRKGWLIIAPAVIGQAMILQQGLHWISISPVLVFVSLVMLKLWNPEYLKRNQIEDIIKARKELSKGSAAKNEILRRFLPKHYFVLNKVLPLLLIVLGISVILEFIQNSQMNFVTFVILFSFAMIFYILDEWIMQKVMFFPNSNNRPVVKIASVTRFSDRNKSKTKFGFLKQN